MNKFEVPYNFDEAIIKYYKENIERINFLYIPPYQDDLANTRSSIQTRTKGHCYMPERREEYEEHLHIIKDAGLKFVVLWQSLDSVINNNQIDYYFGLGTSGFIIGNDENAKIIKDYDSSLLVICSLVQRLRYKRDITNRNVEFYDYIILYYTFNRSIDTIKELYHIKDKIILMPNTLCNIECPSLHHWFPTKSKPFDSRYDCWTKLETMNKCGLIFPEHLIFFDDYVGGYKLQGREYPTEAIKYLCNYYFDEKFDKDFIKPFLREDMAVKLYDLAHNTPYSEYYNIYTSKCNL